jgi:hypothetical protein
MAWKEFEKAAEKFINKAVEIQNVSINLVGGSDSNTKDLVVKKDRKEIFNIEIKEKKAQISQFVVDNNEQEKKYYLGKLNKLAENITEEILEHMNNNYEYYKNPTQAGINLKCTDAMMYKCIEGYLKQKNIKFLISATKANDFRVISANNFKRNFSIINGKYRRKRSGTNKLSEKFHKEVKNYFYNKFEGCKIFESKKRVYIKLTENYLKDLELKINRSFNLKNINIFLSLTADKAKFEIKKKSNTNNPTVIFSVDFHNKDNDNDLISLKKTINDA